MKLNIFFPHQLRSLIEEATVDQSEEQWHQALLAAIAGMVEKSPIVYRSFGPFWWPLKQYLLDAGLIAGEPVDEIVFEQVTLGTMTLDLAAAFAYHDWTTGNLNATNTVWDVVTDTGETIEYSVIDEALEAIIGFS